jgi:hypothetical protein
LVSCPNKHYIINGIFFRGGAKRGGGGKKKPARRRVVLDDDDEEDSDFESVSVKKKAKILVKYPIVS